MRERIQKAILDAGEGCLSGLVYIKPSDAADAVLDAMGFQSKKCKRCAVVFHFGTGTGRRSTAKFCSDKCRKDTWNEAKK